MPAPRHLDTPAKVAGLIGRLRRLYVVGRSALIMLDQPNMFDVFDDWGFDQYAQLSTPRLDGTSHGTPLYETLQDVTARLTDYGPDFERSTLAGLLVTVGDACSQNGYFDRTPALELLRHLRNASGHGNAFNLLNGEPRLTAEYRGFSISSADHGRADVLFTFIGAGDVLNLLSNVENHLREIEGRWS